MSRNVVLSGWYFLFDKLTSRISLGCGEGGGVWELLMCTHYQISHTHTHTYTHAFLPMGGLWQFHIVGPIPWQLKSLRIQRGPHNHIGLNYTFVNTKLLLKMCYNSSYNILGSVNPTMLPQWVYCVQHRDWNVPFSAASSWVCHHKVGPTVSVPIQTCVIIHDLSGNNNVSCCFITVYGNIISCRENYSLPIHTIFWSISP